MHGLFDFYSKQELTPQAVIGIANGSHAVNVHHTFLLDFNLFLIANRKLPDRSSNMLRVCKHGSLCATKKTNCCLQKPFICLIF